MLKCIAPGGDDTCKQDARWLVWYRCTGPQYTYSCDKHLVKRLQEQDLNFCPIVDIQKAPEVHP